jgi:hypothetical protein
MSLYSSDTRYNINNPIYAPLPLNISTLTVSTITAATIYSVSTYTSNLLASYTETTEAYVYDILTIDNQALTANNTSLLLNGVPIATTANLSSIADWSIYPQTSTLYGNKQSTIGISYLAASTIATQNFTAFNIFTQNLMAFNIVNFTSTVIEVYESTIQSDIKLANISTARIGNASVSSGSFSTLNSIVGSFSNLSAGTASINTLTGGTASFCNFTASSITVSSIVSPPVTAGSFSSLTVVSNTNTGSLTVGINNTTSFAAPPTFSDGGNFNGTRPNFNSGIVTSGPNNFNNTNLDNVGNITANTVFVGSPNYVNIQTSSYTKVLNDRGADVGGNSVIELTAQYGAATRVNITAGAASAYAPTPTQIITLTANGATSLTQNAVGGRVSIVANAGSGSGCNILGFGQIDLTAYSSLPFAGVIKESAGSILAYSGLTTPLVGVYGYSFYSALNCLSLTAGSTVPSGSYPGIVYLRGDNGTKVVNGFFADTASISGTTTTSNLITNSVAAPGSSGLAIQAPTNNISIIASTATFLCGIAGDFSVKSIVSLSSINGAPYTPGGGGGSVVSSFTNLATSSFTVSSINGAIYPQAPTWVSTATSRLNMNGNSITDTTGALSLLISSPTVYTAYTQTSTSVDLLQFGGTGYIKRTAAGNVIDIATGNIQTQATSTINTVPHTFFTGDINAKALVNVSTINGTAYPPSGGGSSWVSTATSRLNMAGFPITDTSATLNITTAGSIYISSQSVVVNPNTSVTLSSPNINLTGVINILCSTSSGYTQYVQNPPNINQTASGIITTNAPTTNNNVLHTNFSGEVSVPSLINISSINGVAYGGGGGGWVGTATSDLNMAGYGIHGNPINIYDSFGDQIYLGVGVNITDGNGSVLNFDNAGTVTFSNLNSLNINTAYGDQFSFGDGVYLYPVGGIFYVDNNVAGNPGVFQVGSSSALTANEINLTTNLTVGSGSGNFNVSVISNTTMNSAGTFFNGCGGTLTQGSATIMSNSAPIMYNTASQSTINTCPETTFSGDVKVSSFRQTLIGNPILQPVLQYGFVSTSGSSGTVTVTIPQRYTTQGSYIPFATMMDSPPAQLFTSSISRGSFLIGWSSGGSGSQLFGWQTMGT